MCLHNNSTCKLAIIMPTDVTLHILTTIASKLRFVTSSARYPDCVHFTETWVFHENQEWRRNYILLRRFCSTAFGGHSILKIEKTLLKNMLSDQMFSVTFVEANFQRDQYFLPFFAQVWVLFRVGQWFASFSSLLAKRCHFPPPHHSLPLPTVSHNIMNLMMGEIKFSITPQ